MISSRQFRESLDFLATYKDALNCVESIAERRQAFAHYQDTTDGLVGAMRNGEVSVRGDAVSAGPNAGSFVYKRAHSSAQEIFTKYKLGDSGTREDFTKNLEKAISDLSA